MDDVVALIIAIALIVVVLLVIRELRRPRTIQVRRDEEGNIVEIVET